MNLNMNANTDANASSGIMGGTDNRPRSAVAHFNRRRFPGLMDPQPQSDPRSDPWSQSGTGTGSGSFFHHKKNNPTKPVPMGGTPRINSGTGGGSSGMGGSGEQYLFSHNSGQQQNIPKIDDYLCLFKLINIKTHSDTQSNSNSNHPKSHAWHSGSSDTGMDRRDRHTGNNGNDYSGSNTIAASPTQHQFQLNVSPIIPVLQAAKPLPGNLMRAITSAKLSPSKQYCMLGFGVRTEGVVFGHFAS